MSIPVQGAGVCLQGVEGASWALHVCEWGPVCVSGWQHRGTLHVSVICVWGSAHVCACRTVLGMLLRAWG